MRSFMILLIVYNAQLFCSLYIYHEQEALHIVSNEHKSLHIVYNVHVAHNGHDIYNKVIRENVHFRKLHQILYKLGLPFFDSAVSCHYAAEGYAAEIPPLIADFSLHNLPFQAFVFFFLFGS